MRREPTSETSAGVPVTTANLIYSSPAASPAHCQHVHEDGEVLGGTVSAHSSVAGLASFMTSALRLSFHCGSDQDDKTLQALQEIGISQVL